MGLEENNFYKSANEKFDKEDYQGAIDDYSKIIELDPKNVDAWTQRGDTKFSLKNYHGAIDDCAKAIELDPNNTYAWAKRGEAKFRLK